MKSRTKLILASAFVVYLAFEGLCFVCLWLLPKVANIRYYQLVLSRGPIFDMELSAWTYRKVNETDGFVAG